MNISLTTIKKAYKLFSHAHADKRTIRYNVKAYLKSMALLGDKYILAKHVQRKVSH